MISFFFVRRSSFLAWKLLTFTPTKVGPLLFPSILGPLSSSESLATQKDVSGLKAQQLHTSLVIIILQCLRQNQRSKHWKALAWETIQKARKRVADGPPRELLRRHTILLCQRRIWMEFDILDHELSNARCRHQWSFQTDQRYFKALNCRDVCVRALCEAGFAYSWQEFFSMVDVTSGTGHWLKMEMLVLPYAGCVKQRQREDQNESMELGPQK